jgi:HAD superfamily hydrolase (TIGR01509 family)
VGAVPGLDAVIFDMDGVLIDSEPLWRRAEMARFAEVGVHLTDEECRQTMGFRIDETVAYWHARRPWPDADVPAMAASIVDTVVELVHAEGEALPGVGHAIGVCEKLGLRLAVASSSLPRLITAVLGKLGVDEAFEVVRSAADEPYGKPHPGVLLTTAAALGVDPRRCLVIEDSVNGMVAAAAARMRCIVVPERPDPRFVLAEAVLDSLEDLSPDLLLGGDPQR